MMKPSLKKTSLCVLLSVLSFTVIHAQRPTDQLGRGLVASKVEAGVYLSWRILAEEYYDTKYNVYRNGTRLNDTPLTVSNFTDTEGTASNIYTVSAVVRGVEQSQCKAVNVWAGYKYKMYTTCESGYFDIPLAKVYDNSGNDITDTYIANDCEVADLDGDGEMEIIVKRRSTMDDAANYVSRTDGAYDRIDAYKMDGTLLWWIDAGPNMVSGGSHELNIIAYDWDGDGKAEVLLRGADNMMVHGQRGASRQEWPQRIGKNGVDTRGSVTHTANMTYTNTGDEFLVYMDGDHGIIYDAVRYMSYPLTRGKASDWGDSYGHRSSKYFFGAPFLDGKKPSIFLARGIYTRHKMAAYDVDPSTHSLTQRWTWENNGGWSDPWYGNGNHNYCIADVDMDGRDEIVYGSMVIDDNGKGLSTTGLGHGDALHCSDFDPFRKGLEIFACNEDEPASNYRNATTSQIYHRQTSSSDDGRALCANFSNTYPGAMGRTTQTGMVSCVADKVISEIGDYIAWSDLNFRIYYDGDLLSEVLNSPGTEREAAILKPGSGRLFTSSGCKMNNWTKNHPCFSGDILGDWREEIVMRVGEGHDYIRIYTSCMPTSYPIYSLWFDHQYRQAMVWQMHAYNQPPHLSFFLGELEDLTVPPPPLTLTGRTQLSSGATIGTGYNNQHLLLHENANTTLNVTNGASPYILTINVPTWVQGNNNNSSISTTTYTCNLNGGALTGGMRLVKQGDGILNMAAVSHTYTGETQIWNGTVNFDGSLANSPVSLHRFTTLNSKGTFRSITMEYAASLHPGGDGTVATVTVDSLKLKYGARVVIDFSGTNADKLNTKFISVGKKDWEYGPAYQAPVFQFRNASALSNGTYLIGTCQSVAGELSDIVLEGLSTESHLEVRDNNLYLVVGSGYSHVDEDGNAICSTVAPGTFYFRHVATGQFLTGANTWSTHASISEAATDVTLVSSGNGYTIDSKIYQGNNHYLNSNLYMDGASSVWTFVPTTTASGQQAYLLTADGTNYLTYNGSSTSLVTTTNATDPNALWMLHTKNALVDELAEVVSGADKNATFLLPAPDLSRNDSRNSLWLGSPTIAGTDDNYNGEKFNCTFDVYQILTGVPNGVYTLTCQGFYRNGGYAEAATRRSGGSESLNALLYANSVTAALPSIFVAAGKNGTTGVNSSLGYIPNGQTDAASYLNVGLYAGASVTVTVTDNTLRVGVKKTQAVSDDWTVFDHFRLTYHGPAQTLTPTNYVRNGDFESNSYAGWQTTMEPRNNQLTTNASGFSGFTNHSWETWKGVAMTGKMYQTITDLPSGTYKLTMAAHVNVLGGDEQQFVYANDDQVYLNAESGAYETYVYVNNGVIEIGLNQTAPIANWLTIDNVALYYVSDKPIVSNYNDALARANSVYAKSSTVYAHVTGDELTALEQAMQDYATMPTTASQLQKAISAINTATNAFVAARAAYDNYYAVAASIESLGLDDSTLPYADPTLRTAFGELATATPQNAADAVLKAEGLYAALRAYVESNAEAAKYGGQDFTSSSANAAGGATDGWSGSSNFWTLNNEPYTDAEGNSNYAYIDVNSVSSFTLTQQLTDLPRGYYVLTTTARAQTGISKYQLFADNVNGDRTTKDIPVIGNSGGVFGRGWNDVFLTFVQPEQGNATIGVEAANSSNLWMSAARFRLYRLEADGDVNDDGEVDILDLTIAINKRLGDQPAVFNEIRADMNYDGEFSVVDITMLINKILTQPKE